MLSAGVALAGRCAAGLRARSGVGDGLAALAGAAVVLGYAPFEQFWAALLGYAVLIGLWAARPDRAWRRGAWFGLGLFGVGLYWLFIAVHAIGGAPLPVAVILQGLLVVYLAAYFALGGWLLGVAQRRGVNTLLLIPVLLSLLEWLRGTAFTGFPWLTAGYVAMETPLIGFAPVLGSYGLGLLVLLAATAVVALWRRENAGVWLAALLAVGGVGYGLQRVDWSKPVGAAFNAALLQANIAQSVKWSKAQRMQGLLTYGAMSRQALATADLVIWPETAVPDFIHNVYADHLSALDREAAAADKALLVGAPVLDRAAAVYRNEIVALGAAQGRFGKVHLVPFGEYLPLSPIFGPLVRTMNLPMSSYAPGWRDSQPFTFRGLRLSGSICYEVIFPGEMAALSRAGHVLINVSNDGWFGQTIAPHQHLQMARLRARELSRPMLRATNTGISAVIDHLGVVQARLGLLQAGTLQAVVRGREGDTWFSRHGNATFLAALGVLMALALSMGLARSRKLR